MPPRRKKSAEGEQRLCDCSPFCGKTISERSIRRHHQDIKNRAAGAQSDLESSGSEMDTTSESTEARSPVLAHSPEPPAADLDSAPYAEAEAEDDDMEIDEDDVDSLGSDVESEFELDEEDQWMEFDEGEARDVYTSREEMERELKEMLNPDEEAALWEISTSFVSLLPTNLLTKIGFRKRDSHRTGP